MVNASQSELSILQKVVFENKVNHGFNVTDIPLEFCLLEGEVSEAFDAWKNDKEDLRLELADVAIYLLGIAEILNINLLSAIKEKIDINKDRHYDNNDFQESKMGYCKDCNWWKDSDGVYRRGCDAESQCPINHREVFDGNGYCYMFKPRESENKE